MISNGASQEKNTVNIFVFITCFTLAILFSSFIFISPVVSVLLILVGFAILGVEKLSKGSIAKEIIVVSLILVSLGLGFLRYAIKDFHIPDPTFESRIGEQIEFQGLVVSEPEKRDNDTRIVVSSGIEKILVNTDLYSLVQYGDEVRVSGKLKKPDVIESETGRDFDYGEYLAKDNIYYTSSFAQVSVLSSGHGNVLKRGLFGLKHSLVANMKEVLAEPESSLLAGLIVSGKDAMPKSILEEFRRAGVVHIVVLSGYNITIIADFIRKFFETIFVRARLLGQAGALMRFGPQLAAGASILGIICFILMTGAQATVVRAGLMVLVVVGAKMFGRTYSAPRALMAAAFLMLVHNPKILVFDASFQLSFLATCALIYVSPVVEKYLAKMSLVPRSLNEMGEKWGVRTMIATTIATQVVVLPYLIYMMGNFSLVSLPANVLILLFIPVTMLIGFIASILGYVGTVLALPFSYAAHLLLAWILGVSSVLGNLKFASIGVAKFPFWVVVIVYILYLWIFSKNILRRRLLER
ncbi:MAG: ComEC/Rec2 family competence protein [bacterium]